MNIGESKLNKRNQKWTELDVWRISRLSRACRFQQIAACNAWRQWWDIDGGGGEGVKWKVEIVSKWNSWFQVQLQGGLYDINDATRGDETHSIQWPLWDDVSNDEHRVWVKPTSVISFTFGLVEPWILNLVNRSRIRCLSPQFEGTKFIG